jgi:ubiquinone/menaquinone biosynthesis C-methylase UbiE
MVDLQNYYDERVKGLNADQQLEQVGHTVSGKAISDQEFDRLIDEIVALLLLDRNDNLLDLCCGNGRITREISNYCNQATAVDFSQEMISNANLLNSGDNIVYYQSDVLQLKSLGLPLNHYSKVLMYGGLQHFTEGKFEDLIALIRVHCSDQFVIIFGFVPNAKRKWDFYDTLAKKIRYLFYRITRRDVLGTWWSKNKISIYTDLAGLSCQFFDVPNGRYGHPYRFHAVISNL